MTSVYCLQCGERIEDDKLSRNPDQKFCKSECAFAYRRAHPDLYRAQREATAKANKQRWADWKARGIDPAHGSSAAAKRAAKIAESNRDKPRRRKAQE